MESFLRFTSFYNTFDMQLPLYSYPYIIFRHAENKLWWYPSSPWISNTTWSHWKINNVEFDGRWKTDGHFFNRFTCNESRCFSFWTLLRKQGSKLFFSGQNWQGAGIDYITTYIDIQNKRIIRQAYYHRSTLKIPLFFFLIFQVTDYADRKNMPVSEVEKWLSSNLSYSLDD